MSNKYIFIIAFLTLSTFSFGQSFCLSFSNPQVTDGGTIFQFDINIQRNGSAFNLGSSNLVFNFNIAGLSTPMLVSHTLPLANYSLPTVTNPLTGRASFNIVLNNDNNGILVNTSATLLGRVKFNILNPTLMSDMNWLYTGTTIQTVVFNDVFPSNSQLFATNNMNTCLQPLQSPLPLRLLSFSSSVAGKAVELTWKTTDERDVSHFDVQRSLDGINFKSIGDVQADNNRTSAQYSYLDEDVVSGQKYYYRLNLVDMDGKQEYSNITSEMIPLQNKHFRVFPNPIAKNMLINVISEVEITSTFKLYDAKNTLIIEKTFNNQLQVDTQGLLSGVYFYTIENGGNVDHGKIVIVE